MFLNYAISLVDIRHLKESTRTKKLTACVVSVPDGALGYRA